MPASADKTVLRIIDQFTTLLLDMNSTFMFNEDRFGPAEDYHATYRQWGGALTPEALRTAIEACLAYMEIRYPDPVWHNQFPTVKAVLGILPETTAFDLTELDRIAETIALHELGHIPESYADVLHQLAQTHQLAVVADIWSEKSLWIIELERAGVLDLFDVQIYSSDIGSVKPSAKPFLRAIEALGVSKSACVMVGDSARRDIGGAEAAGIAGIWIGKGEGPAYAIAQVEDLRLLV
ncbi:MAG: HAD-IA family hydrolase [Bacteroidota bacterium]